MLKHLRPAVTMIVVMTALTGLAYPLAVTGAAQALFPDQANGSLIKRDGRVIGSALIAQSFTGPGHFHPRPSAAGAGYEADNSGAGNLGPSNRSLITAVTKRVEAARHANPGATGPVPTDLVTASGSGLDPHLTPAAVRWQAARVAEARGLPLADVLALLESQTEGRDLGVLGEPRVNVLRLNLALDELQRQPR